MELTDGMRDLINKSLKERGLPTIDQGATPINDLFGVSSVPGLSKPLSAEIDEETHLRYGYVSFVIAEVAWDYVDTVLNMACLLRRRELRRLCRTIKEIREDYLWWRRKFSGQTHLDNEEENMETFQEDLNEFFSSMYRAHTDKLKNKYPDIYSEYIMMIATAYMSIIVFDALFKYVRYMEGIVINKVRHPIGNILPKHLHQIAMLMPEFAGDCPIKSEFELTRSFFVDTLVTQIKSIELFD